MNAICSHNYLMWLQSPLYWANCPLCLLGKLAPSSSLCERRHGMLLLESNWGLGMLLLSQALVLISSCLIVFKICNDGVPCPSCNAVGLSVATTACIFSSTQHRDHILIHSAPWPHKNRLHMCWRYSVMFGMIFQIKPTAGYIIFLGAFQLRLVNIWFLQIMRTPWYGQYSSCLVCSWIMMCSKPQAESTQYFEHCLNFV